MAKKVVRAGIFFQLKTLFSRLLEKKVTLTVTSAEKHNKRMRDRHGNPPPLNDQKASS